MRGGHGRAEVLVSNWKAAPEVELGRSGASEPRYAPAHGFADTDLAGPQSVKFGR
jgi:hypothetical protein